MTPTTSERQATIALKVSTRCRSLLAGLEPNTQGAILADLLATFLAGHQGPDAPAFREEILELHIATVRDLIPVCERQIAEEHDRTSDLADNPTSTMGKVR